MAPELSRNRHAFPSTHWSLIARTSGPDVQEAQDTLARLLERYYPALLTHLRYRFAGRVGTQEAEDLLQGFVADKVLARNLIARADPARGRFRTFILTALDRYVLDWLDQNKRAASGSDSVIEALPQDGSTSPDFDIAWARELIGQAIERMRSECLASHPARWTVFEARVLAPAMEEAEPVPYAELVDRHGFTSPIQAGNVLITGKRMFARILREIVGEYACDEAEIEEELADLRAILASSGA